MGMPAKMVKMRSKRCEFQLQLPQADRQRSKQQTWIGQARKLTKTVAVTSYPVTLETIFDSLEDRRFEPYLHLDTARERRHLNGWL